MLHAGQPYLCSERGMCSSLSQQSAAAPLLLQYGWGSHATLMHAHDEQPHPHSLVQLLTAVHTQASLPNGDIGFQPIRPFMTVMTCLQASPPQQQEPAHSPRMMQLLQRSQHRAPRKAKHPASGAGSPRLLQSLALSKLGRLLVGPAQPCSPCSGAGGQAAVAFCRIARVCCHRAGSCMGQMPTEPGCLVSRSVDMPCTLQSCRTRWCDHVVVLAVGLQESLCPGWRRAQLCQILTPSNSTLHGPASRAGACIVWPGLQNRQQLSSVPACQSGQWQVKGTLHKPIFEQELCKNADPIAN